MTGRCFKAAKLFGTMMGATVMVCAATELLTYVVVGHLLSGRHLDRHILKSSGGLIC